jgi:hypothetical protein
VIISLWPVLTPEVNEVLKSLFQKLINFYCGSGMEPKALLMLGKGSTTPPSHMQPLNTSLNSEVPLLTPENKGYYAFQTSWHLIFGNINANCCF